MRNLASRLIRRLASPGAWPAERAWAVPAGRRIYAIGDIHGRLDLLARLCSAIERDSARRDPSRTTLVFLGDLVDRGPDSCGVIDFLIDGAALGVDCVFLGGNHDEVFVRAAEGEREAALLLHKMGGRPTALSYGITAEEYDAGSFDDLAMLLRERVPRAHVAFLRSFKSWHQIGDYVFAHAGIKPGVPLHEQVDADLRWIRRGFLEWEECHGAMIVHGHTVTAKPDLRFNRIGIDTGAFRSGKLTALGIEGTERWTLST